MQGPSAAAMSPRLAPSRSIAATVASTTPVSAPFQPACAAPTTRACASANRIMPQSAPVTPSARPGVAVDDPVAARPRVRRPVLGDRDRVGGMDLIGHREALGRDAERGRHAGAVLGDRLRRVARADAAVERSVDALRDAAARVKKACAHSRQLQGVGREEGRRRSRRSCAAAGWKPGGGGSLRFAMAIALNSAPISPLPLPTRRSRVCLSSSARSGSASLGERLGPEVDADRAQEVALVDRAIDRRPGRAGAARHGGEIDMGGEIAIARRGERIDIAVGAQRLQRVAEAR